MLRFNASSLHSYPRNLPTTVHSPLGQEIADLLFFFCMGKKNKIYLSPSSSRPAGQIRWSKVQILVSLQHPRGRAGGANLIQFCNKMECEIEKAIIHSAFALLLRADSSALDCGMIFRNLWPHRKYQCKLDGSHSVSLCMYAHPPRVIYRLIKPVFYCPCSTFSSEN